MALRHRHRKGDWLVEDEVTGYVHYRSQMTRRWDGAWVHKKNFETRQPQEFVDAGTDPQVVYPTRPQEALGRACFPAPEFVGNTNVIPSKTGPGWQIWDLPIGEMEVGCSFSVRPTPGLYRTEE